MREASKQCWSWGDLVGMMKRRERAAGSREELKTMGMEGLRYLMEQAAGDKIKTCRLSFVKRSGSI